MKAVEYYSYGNADVLEVIDVQKPEPKENEVLIKIMATTVTATECAFRKGDPYMARLFTGLRKPKINRLGEELSGIVEGLGDMVVDFQLGDEVFGTAGPSFGANAEYICIPQDEVIFAKPSNVTHGEAASSIDGFLTALPFLRDKGNIKAGQKVLIYGASGSVGSAAVQIAKHYGAEVTAVCSGRNALLVKSIGADFVIDYKLTDFSQLGNSYDLIFDCVGKISYAKARKSLTKRGVFLESGINFSVFKDVLFTSVFSKRKAKIAATGMRPPALRLKDLQLLKDLIEKNNIKPVIDRNYTMESIADAHRYVEQGHKRGNVVILPSFAA